MTSHDVTSQVFRRTSALSTAASVILLNKTKRGLWWCACFPNNVSLLFKVIFAYICICVCVCASVYQFAVPTCLELFT